ncbi:hypothetical protein ACFL7E_08225 [Thermodesulfobacteriota bacterium]
MKRCIKFVTGKSLFSLPLVFLMMVLLSSPGALAQQPASEADAWQFGLSIYGWFPDMAGKTSFTQPGGSNEFGIDIENILDNLEFTLMGTFDARKGRWGILTDVIYMDVGNSQTGTREATIGRRELPVNATANVNLDLKSWIWTLAGYYRALDQPGMTLDVVAGARYLDVEQKVNWVVTGNVGSIPVPDRTGAAEVGLTNWDAIIGVKGRFAFGPNNAWFVPYYFDVGAGDSDFTWQGAAGLGYAFNWGDIAAVWRHLDYDLSEGKAIDDVRFSGPAIGVAFRW